MSDRRSSSDLGSSAEATLGAFPFPDRDWERDARAIEARLAASVHGSTDASLLAAPLPSEAGEPSTAPATATPLTNSGVRTQSLAELARRSVERKQAAERQMARESLALASQRRQRSTDNDERSPSVSMNGGAASNVAASGSRAMTAHGVVAGAASREGEGSVNHLPKVALALPVLALAAAALLWFRPPEPSIAASVASPTPSAAALSPGPASAQARNAASAATEVPRGIDPSTLPGEANEASASPIAKVAAASSSAAVASPAKSVVSKGSASEHGTSGAKAEQGLPPDPALRPADSLGGEMPSKPTTGAVQAALGAVLSGARHCVAGDQAPSSAVVVFGSDGRVQQVTVSGAAAGKSSASCIEAQLRRARVQPFASPSFSVNATVRPE